MQQAAWSENVILVDADYVDRVAFDLIVNFERMLERRIPPADLGHWLDCIALDGGLRPGRNDVQAIFLHTRELESLRNFRPAHFRDELDAKAFSDRLGEFTLHSFSVEEIVSPLQFFLQSLAAIGESEKVKRIMVVGDMDRHAADIRKEAQHIEGKDITLFTMQPLAAGGLRQEILGYSLMSALGVESKELQG